MIVRLVRAPLCALALAAPAFAQDAATPTVFRDARGVACTPPGAGVVACPVLKDVGDPSVIGYKKQYVGLKVRFSYCVSEMGKVEDVVVNRSSSDPKYDQGVLRWFKKVKFTPGTLDGAAVRICGMNMDYEMAKPVHIGTINVGAN